GVEGGGGQGCDLRIPLYFPLPAADSGRNLIHSCAIVVADSELKQCLGLLLRLHAVELSCVFRGGALVCGHGEKIGKSRPRRMSAAGVRSQKRHEHSNPSGKNRSEAPRI